MYKLLQFVVSIPYIINRWHCIYKHPQLCFSFLFLLCKNTAGVLSTLVVANPHATGRIVTTISCYSFVIYLMTDYSFKMENQNFTAYCLIIIKTHETIFFSGLLPLSVRYHFFYSANVNT